MHSRAIVSEQRLRHERSRHAALTRDVLDHVLVDHHVVGHASKRGKAHVDLALAAGRDFMVASTATPIASRIDTTLVRASWSRSAGGTGKYPSLGRSLCPRLGPFFFAAFQLASMASIS